jgi:class 3 adenylate cyclase/predicted ATPase
MGERAMEASTEALKAKRTRATALFADIVGFTAISERMGPEQAYLIVTGCLKRLDSIARRNGAAVDKRLGDRMLAVFGYPVPVEDPEIAAVDAASEMRESVYHYNRELRLEIPLDIHIGVNTGVMIAGEIHGSLIREIDVLGDAVNIAARLRTRSPLGQIYVGPETYRETSHRFEYRPLEPMKLKGLEKPVAAYALVAPKKSIGRGRIGSSEMVFSELVGREDEIGRLKRCVSSLGEGRGRIVTLVGEEGIGKSRLLTQLGAVEEFEAVAFFQARSLSVRKAQDFQSFPGLLRAWAEIDEEDDEKRSLAKLEAAVLRWLPEVPPEVFRSLAAVMAPQPPAKDPRRPGSIEGDATREAVAASLAAVLRKMAEVEPLVLVFEDLQWIDQRSVEVLERLLDLVMDHAILFILSFRPDFADTSQRILEFVRAHHAGQHEEIQVGPLGSEESRRLVGNLAGTEGLPEETRVLIDRRAQGNPRRLIMGVFLAPSLRLESDHSTERDRRTTEAERRRATILFADITGYTAITEKLGPERAYSLIDGCLRVLDDVARRHGGTVDTHLGDCVLALFGVPEAIEDAPRAAINAAIEMRHRVRDYSREHGLTPPLDIHTGINTGLGIAGDVSGPLIREFAVMGDPVEVASRLTDLAPAGRVYIGSDTYLLTRDLFEYRPLESIQLKGREPQTPAYELLSEAARLYRPTIGSGRRIFSELVGREEELGRLEEILARVRRGEGAIVSLIAEAGIGKSRLVAELSSTEDAKAVNWCEGRSLSTGQNLSFHPFADLFRRWADINDEDDGDQERVKLEALVSSILPGEAEEVFPFIASVQGARLTEDQEERLARIHGEAKEKRIRGSVLQLLSESSEKRPLVVMLDDLHWADQSSIELLEGLLRLVVDHPIFFLLVSRPGYQVTSQRIQGFACLHHREWYTEIRLDPLDARATRHLVNNLFKQGEIPRATQTLIEEKAHGNPFYLEEVVRSFVDEGAVEYRDGSFHATDKIRSVVIPGTVHEVIMARVDRLDLRKRRLLQAASVIGATFHQVVLAEIRGDGVELDQDLGDLMEAEFLIPGDRLQGAEYAFKHPLVQEVTYDAILHSRREELHLQVARAIESRLSEDVAGFRGMLAFHFSMGKDAERAEEYLFRAGDEAARVAASSQALHFFREASKLYFQLHGEGGDPAKKALLRKKIALALFHRGQLIDAEQEFDEALDCLGEPIPRSERARILRLVRDLISVLVRLYLPEKILRAPPATPVQSEAIDLMFERGQCQITADPTRFVFDSLGMVARLQRIDPKTVPTSGRVFAGSSQIFSYGGVSFAISRRFLNLARSLVREDDIPAWFMYRTVNFLHHMFEGDWSEEHEIEEALIQESLQYGQLWDVVTYLGTHADKKISTGEFGVARERIEQIAKIRDQYEYELAKSTHYALAMFLALEQGRLEEALVAADAYYEENPEDLLHVHALGGKAKAQVLLDDRKGAEETLTKCATIVARAGRGRVPPYQLSNYLRSRFLLDLAALEAAARGDDRVKWRSYRKRARKSGRAALAVASKCASRRTEIYRLAGVLDWLVGKPGKALEWWRKSIESGQSLGAQPELGRTYAEVARRLGPERSPIRELDGIDAKTYRQSATKILGDLGLERDLARLSE